MVSIIGLTCDIRIATTFNANWVYAIFYVKIVGSSLILAPIYALKHNWYTTIYDMKEVESVKRNKKRKTGTK